MTIFQAIYLGLIQGITEFLPVSSTGHLIIFRKFLNQDTYGTLAFDAVLQLATTLALIVYFRKDLFSFILSAKKFIREIPRSFTAGIDNRVSAVADSYTNIRAPVCLANTSSALKRGLGEMTAFILTKERDENFQMIFYIFLVTLPAVFFGVLLEDKMDTIFRNPIFVSVFLILGSLLMYFAENYHKKIINFQKLDFKKSIIIGFFQSLALFPGFSRSGATISGGLLTSLQRVDAVRFSFLASIPILLGTGLKKLFSIDLHSANTLLISSVFAFLSALLAIHILIKFLKGHRLNIFIFYRIILAILVLIYI